jgi:beta-phosphoglucomutase-like phosphatase (HAD superfamily)
MKTLALDFDGVIASTQPAKVEFAREAFGLDLDESLLKGPRFVEIFGYDEGNRLYTEVYRGVYGSERMLTHVAPVPGAREGIAALQARGYRCLVVTSRDGPADDPDSLAGWARRFLVHHSFTVQHADFFTTCHQSKLAICQATAACALVDDDYEKLLPVMAAGLPGYLFTTNANKDDEALHDPFLAIRVDDWDHLLKIL